MAFAFTCVMPIIMPLASVRQCGAKRPLKAGTKARPPDVDTDEASLSVCSIESNTPIVFSQLMADPATAIEPLGGKQNS